MRICPQCQSSCEELHKFCPGCGFPIGKVATDTEDPLIGRTLPGGYVILDLVGIGGMGRVYRAEQTTLGRTVAVKIIHPHLVGEENAAARFITEARAASRLNHPNSVGVIDFGKTQDGQLYLVMEFLRGRDLARIAYEEGPLPFRRIIGVMKQVLAALAEAHHLEIIHRDLKPENIILEPMRSGGDFVKVVDFGLAKMRVEAQARSITSPGIVCGTPEYMSPEQGRGDELDARSDLYAVGVILFQLTTGHLPFEADSPTQVVLMHLSQAPPDPRKIAPERQIPEPLVQLLYKSLAKERDERYTDADDFADALTDVLARMDGPVSPKGEAVPCPTCGSMNGATQKFCGNCGQSTTISRPMPASERPPASQPPAHGSPPETSGITARKKIEPGKMKFPLALVGRDEELAWLDVRRNEATKTLVAARIVGEPGMGKSRLLSDFLDVCLAAGDVVAEAAPDPTWAEVGYYALRRAVRSLAELPSDGGAMKDWAGASGEARRGLTDIFDKESNSLAASRLSPDERRFAAAEALRWALSRASERGRGHRVVLAVDDLQAVDGASRNAFADVICDPPLVPVLLLANSAPGFDPGWPAVANASLTLRGLSGDIVAKLISASGAPSSPSFSSGRGIVPLYLDQVLRFSREQGGVAPARLADLIALRVERLPADGRRVFQAIAVLGDATSEDDLLDLLPPNTDLVGALALLASVGMIEKIEDPPGCWRTAHPLMREVVLATIPAAVRRDLHAVAARTLVETKAPIEVQALHEYHAHHAFEALLLLEKVSTRCAARGDSQGSVLALRRGLELARRELFRGELDDPIRAMLIFSRKLGEALAQAGDYMDAEGVLREALDMAGPSGQDRAKVLGALAHVALARERRLEAQVYLREALELASRSGARDLVTSLESLKRSIAV